MSTASQPKRVGIKSGCWTILHAGHIAALRYARERCDHLIVLTNTDDRVAAKRGCVPVSMRDRLDILRELRCVNEVGSFPQLTEENWVSFYKDNILYRKHGEDAKLIMFHDAILEGSDNVPCTDMADEIVFIPYAPSVEMKTSVNTIFKLIKDYGE